MAMQTGLSGYTQEFGTGAMRGRFYWTESYDISTNTSNVTIYPQFKAVSYYGYAYYLNGSYNVDGTAVATMSSSSGDHSLYVNTRNTWLAPTGGGTSFSKNGIAHNNDGSRTITLQFDNVRGYTTSGNGGSGWTVSGSVSIALTNIPRGSTVTATDANIGAVSTVVVNRKVSGASHSIRYSFGSLSGYITAAGGVSTSEVKFTNTTVNWTVPTAFYGQIPKASSGKCTLTITTYQSSGAKVGDAKTASLTVTTTAALSGPSVSGSVADVNSVTTALTGNNKVLVTGFSTARAAVTASARNSASITSRAINGTGVSGDTYVDYAKVTAASFTFAATDSRGFSAQTTVRPTMLGYIPLTLNGACVRTSPTANTATLTLSGNYFNASFGAAANTLAVTYKIGGGNVVTLEPKISGNTWSASVSLSGYPYTEAYAITVKAVDKLVSLQKTVTLNRGIPVFDWGKDSFRVNVPVGLAGGLDATTKKVLLDFIYPVGSYYWSSSSTNPGTLFGGTWTQITGRFVLAAGGGYNSGATGGAATHSHGVGSYIGCFEMGSPYNIKYRYISSSKWQANYFTPQNSNGPTAEGCSTGMEIIGTSATASTMPPYIVAYCWRRTA